MNPLSLPVIAVQGLWVKRTTERLPESAGPVEGLVGELEELPDAGQPNRSQVPLKLAIIGESTAAGCGVATHDEAMAGCLARELHVRWGRPLAWSVTGRNGADLSVVRTELLSRVSDGLRLAVLLVGVNDVLARRSPQEWEDQLAMIVDELKGKSEEVVVVGVPDFGQFPSLPGTLGRWLSARAALFDSRSREVCAVRPGVRWTSSVDVLSTGPEFFARDGFHPSGRGYAEWAAHLAREVAEYEREALPRT